jgi:hypothetical protein
MWDGVAVADLDFGTIFAAGAEQRADDALLVGGSAEGVVEDRENGLVCVVRTYTEAYDAANADLRLNDYVQRGSRRLRTDGGRAKRAREMEEGIFVVHVGGLDVDLPFFQSSCSFGIVDGDGGVSV